MPIGNVQGVISGSTDGARHRSPVEGQIVEISGVVHQELTWSDSQGREHFAIGIQNLPEEADGDPLSSDGILVYLGRNRRVNVGGATRVVDVGSRVLLRGKVVERYGQTEIERPEFLRATDGSSFLPQLKVGVAAPPSDLAEAARYWERLEGMRIQLSAGAVVTGPTHVYGEGTDAQCWVIAGRHEIVHRDDPFHRRVFRDAHPLDDLAALRFDNGNGFRIQVNSYGLGRDDGGRLRLLPAAAVGATLSDPCRGIVLYGYSNYRLALDTVPSFTDGPDHRRNRPADDPDHLLRFATYNVENLYDHRDDPSDPCDGENNPGTASISPPFNYLPENEAEYRDRVRRLARNIVVDMKAPTVLLLQELEGQDILPLGPGGKRGNGQNDILEDLSLAVVAAGGPRYRSLVHVEGADERGITCGFLYQVDRLRPIDLTQHPVWLRAQESLRQESTVRITPSADRAVMVAQGEYRERDGTIVPTFSRRVQLVGLAEIGSRERVIYFLNNHFSSRPDQRLLRRKAQATVNAQVVRALLQVSPQAEIVVGGDLNVYARPDDPFTDPPSDQLKALYDVGLTPALEQSMRVAPGSTYTYVYMGQAQILDHLFLSPALSARVSSVWVSHINSDWPRAKRFPWKVSDHDPVMVDLRSP